jgi:hypothetical protein
MKNEITTQGGQLSRNQERGLSMIDKLSALENDQKLRDLDTDKAISYISKQLVRIYAFLGHRNIFKGDATQIESAKAQIREISAQILSGIKENKNFRLVTDKDFDAIISKGTADALSEIKHVSARSVFQWIKDFQEIYQKDIVRARLSLQKEAQELSPLERERKSDREGIFALFTYLTEGAKNDFADYRLFYGREVTRYADKYKDFLDPEFVSKWSKRSDLWKVAQEEAQDPESIDYKRPILSKTSKQETERDRTARLYCYNIITLFTFEHEGDTETRDLIVSACDQYFQQNKNL